MRKHQWEVHKNCDIQHCAICEGGLAACVVCGSAEGTLTTECPARLLTDEQTELVYAGKLDYVNGGWNKNGDW